VLKDVVLTGTGVFCILFEVFSLHPSGLILGTGLVLTVPSTADHLRALLPAVGGGQPSPSSAGGSSSSSSPPPGQQPSPTSSPEVSAGE
jgi:hypothetical protein